MIEIHEQKLIDEYIPNCIFSNPYDTDTDLCVIEQLYAHMMGWA